MKFWHGWRGDLNGNPTFFYRDLFTIFGWRVTIHKFVSNDMLECFHSHPAVAYRVVLWGGYEEEVMGDEGVRHIEDCDVGYIGRVTPDYVHRIHSLKNQKTSVSLWIRGPKTDEIKLIGDGWKKQVDTNH